MTRLLSKKVLLILIPVVLLGGLAGAGFLLAPKLAGGPLSIKISTGATESATPAAAADGARAEAGKTDVRLDPARAERKLQEYPILPFATRERVVNLADKGGFRYLKVEVVLDVVVPHSKPGDKLPKGEAIQALQKEIDAELALVKPRFEDAINSTLASKTSEELMSSEGKQRLRDELRAKLDRLSETPVVAVYFTQFIIQ